jgi:VWFA-related protein
MRIPAAPPPSLPGLRPGLLAAVAPVLCLLAAAAAPAADPAGETLDSDLVEQQVVAVAEILVLATDREGRPVTDLRAAEIRVFEAGAEQKVAFVEPVSRGRPEPSPDAMAAPPAPLYTRDGSHAPGRPTAVLPAVSLRRVVLAFDVRNSRKSARAGWQQAARDWLAEGMQPQDRVGMVTLGRYPEWLVEFTDDRARLLDGLAADKLLQRTAPGRDRTRYVSALMDDLRTCREAETGRVASGDLVDCAYTMARARVPRWYAEARESVGNLDALVGQLAAIPGRKAVLLFSEGIVDDPAMIAVYAILSGLGAGGEFPDIQKMKARIGNDVHAELRELRERAREAEVSFFALNTKERDARGLGANLEQPSAMPTASLGAEPWRDMDTATRETLDELARDTGGRSFLGREELGDNLAAAADGYFGMYTVGYYRADPRGEPGKLRVEVGRKGVRLSHTERPALGGSQAEAAALEITIGQPRPDGASAAQHLPLVISMGLDELPLRRAGRSVGTVLGLHVQAIRPDGTVAAERLDVETVAIARKDRDAARGTHFAHRTELLLAPGPYRIRARVSDDRQTMLADRAIDLTLEDGSVRPGLGAP